VAARDRASRAGDMKPGYGIDAPGVVRSLLLASAAGLWSGVLAIPPGGARAAFRLCCPLVAAARRLTTGPALPDRLRASG
jgi:hypothetical protein